MIDTSPTPIRSAKCPEHLDVLIIGAGISGLGAAHKLIESCPEKRFAMLETKASFGGTWRQHTYPGIRSDSDLYTFGYGFKPWSGKPIASGEAILDYLGEVIEDDQLEQHIRYNHKVLTASWSSDKQSWLITALDKSSNEQVQFTCTFLWMCQGYYRHDKGYTPKWDGMGEFTGQIVHPQCWPEGLEYAGKRVVVIGSGATAATIVPNIADDSSHVTMLQRSPTYFWTGENRNELADQLQELDVPAQWSHEIVRRSILKKAEEVQALALSDPELVKEELLKVIRDNLGEDFDMTHFTPSYRPWQQRLAYVPDGDLFDVIKSGKVSVVTDQIERFTPEGILTKSGILLEADIIVTATGFDLCMLGDIAFDVDDEAVDFSKAYTYRGIMCSGVPNMSMMFGYLRTSWTMRVDLVNDYICRLLKHMDSIGAASCTPLLRTQDQDMTPRPWITEDDFNPGYMKRGSDLLPKQGDHSPWTFTADYYQEKDELPAASLDDGALVYTPSQQQRAVSH